MRILRKTRVYHSQTIQQEEVAIKIAAFIINKQVLLANYLNAKTNTLSKKDKLILFAVFSILLAAINIYILV